MNRREMLVRTGASTLTLGLAGFPLAPAGAAHEKKHVLMYTRSQGFQHSVVTRHDGKLSLAERIVTDLGSHQDFDVVCEKDGGIFDSRDFDRFDAFMFETQGNLLSPRSVDGSKPMTAAGKRRLLEAVASGKGFVGSHCASDTFHSSGPAFENQPRDKQDPYIGMLGGEFIRHGAQQKAWMRVAGHHFPGLEGLKDFEKLEEWYSLKNFAPDLHVILVQDTHGMKGFDYERPNYPATWARMHHKGRVFFTSLGHREDVWESHVFHQVLGAGLAWALGRTTADLTPNLHQAAPHAYELPGHKQAAGGEKKDHHGWVELFNGKDLTGWKKHPGNKDNWEVKDGLLIGSGGTGHLFSERGDYQNFRFRVEAMINDHGNSGQYFRTRFEPGFPHGYEAQINSTHRDPVKTGSLYNFVKVYEMLVPPNTWFTQEVYAVGNHIIIKVNGKTTVDFVDKNNTYTRGHFALQQHDPGSVVKFRKIEVQELPSTSAGSKE